MTRSMVDVRAWSPLSSRWISEELSMVPSVSSSADRDAEDPLSAFSAAARLRFLTAGYSHALVRCHQLFSPFFLSVALPHTEPIAHQAGPSNDRGIDANPEHCNRSVSLMQVHIQPTRLRPSHHI